MSAVPFLEYDIGNLHKPTVSGKQTWLIGNPRPSHRGFLLNKSSIVMMNMTRRGPGHVGIGFVQPKNGRAMFTKKKILYFV